MNKDLILAIEALEKENGISKEVMFDAIEKSLMDEYKAEFDKADNGRVLLDRITGDFHIYSDRTVVEKVEVPEFRENKKEKYVSGTEIAIEDARKIKPGCQIGDVITIEVKSEEFSRKAAKNAKNTIVQTIREQEKNALYNELHDKEREIITGVVQRINENGDMTIDIGRTQAVLKADDKSRNGEGSRFKDKEFKPGDRIKVYVVSVSNRERNGLGIKISRKSPEFVKKLFEEEVTEIKDGTVEIMAIAREAGSRAKVAVYSAVPNIDTIGACIGQKGARIKNIVDELNGERIDIVEWKPVVEEFVSAVLSPAVVESVTILEDGTARVLVEPSQLSLAIGKNGQNARLAARLTGMRVDIKVIDKDKETLKEGEDE